MAVIGAKGRFVDSGGSLEDDTKDKAEFVCSRVMEFCHENIPLIYRSHSKVKNVLKLKVYLLFFKKSFN